MNVLRTICALTLLLLLISSANAQRQRGSRVVSPEVDGEKVTFRLLAPDAKAVRLSGSDIPGLGREGAEMTKNAEGAVSYTHLTLPTICSV